MRIQATLFTVLSMLIPSESFGQGGNFKFQWKPTDIDFFSAMQMGGQIRASSGGRVIVQIDKRVLSCPSDPVTGVDFGSSAVKLKYNCAELQHWTDAKSMPAD